MDPITSPAPAEGQAPPRRRLAALVIPAFVLIATLALLGWSAWPVITPVPTARVGQAIFDRSSVTPVSTTTASRPRRSVPTVQAAGWLEASPFYTACTALADGVVESIEVLEGEHVEQGQVVARLVDEDSALRLRRAEADLASAQAALSSAIAELDAATTAWDEPVELDRAVEVGKAALAESKAEIEQLPTLIDGARATLVRLEEEYERAQESYENDVSNELEVIVARQHAAAQRAEVDALEQRRPILEARVARLRGELRAAERDLALRIEDRRRLDDARARVQRADSDVARMTALRDEAQLEYDRMTIYAPIAGYVQSRLKVPGDKVIRMMDDPHSAHLVHLYDPEKLQVRVDVPLADASHVSVGQRCDVIVEVLPDRTFEGELLRITHEADLQKNTLEVQVKVIDPSPVLRPEMLTRVKFLPPGDSGGATEANAAPTDARVLVPEESIDERNGAPRVWTVADRNTGRGVLTPVSVRTLERKDGYITVVGALAPGTLLALDWQDARAGARVKIANPEGGAP